MKTWQRIILSFVLMLVVVGTYITFTEIQVEAHSPLYWYGGTGNWSSGTTHWSTNSGNVPDSTHATPTSTDSVIFDNLSFTAGGQTMTVDTTANCHDMTWTAVTNTPTWAGSAALNINGSFTAGVFTRTYTGAITFTSTAAGETITMSTKTFSSTINFNGAAGGWVLQDAFGNDVTKTVTLTNGTLDTNGQTVTIGAFATAVGTNALTLGASTFNCKGWTSTELDTLTEDTSNIVMTGANTFTGKSETYYGLTINPTSGGTAQISGANTFTNLTLNNTLSNDIVQVNSDQVVTGTFTAAGVSASNRLAIVGSPLIKTITAATVTVTKTDFKLIAGAGGGDWDLSSAGEDTIDYGFNTGITFTYPLGNERYWYGGPGSWKDYAEWEQYNWSTTSGGISGAKRNPPPTSDDNVHFTALSGMTPGNNTVALAPYYAYVECLDLDFTGSELATSIYINDTGGKDIYVYGSLTLVSGMSEVTGGNDYFQFKGSGDITSAGFNFASHGIKINSTGTYTLQDDLNISMRAATSFVYTAGTLDTNGKTIYLTGVAPDFSGGGKTYDAVVWTSGASGARQLIGNNTIGTVTDLGSGGLTILGQNNITNLTRQGTATYTDYLKFVADQYITNLDLHGYNTRQRLLFASSVAGTQHQISVSGTVHVTNTNISDSAKVGLGNPDISAGYNSDYGGNLGWIFTTGLPLYWVGNTGSWSDLTNHWSLTSGGLPGTAGRVPLIQDTAVFDANSFAIAGRTVTIDITDISGIDASAATNSPTITKAGTIDVYGDVNLGTLTYTVTTTNFKGLDTTLASTSTLTTAMYVLKNEYFMSSLYLNSNVTVSGTVYVQSGVFNHNGWSLTATAYDSATTTYNRQIILGYYQVEYECYQVDSN
jgi:hypothetical protein